MTAGSSVLTNAAADSISYMSPGQILPFESIKLVEILVLFAGGGDLNTPILKEAFNLVAYIDHTELARYQPSHIEAHHIQKTNEMLT
jgi:hypothetical protein